MNFLVLFLIVKVSYYYLVTEELGHFADSHIFLVILYLFLSVALQPLVGLGLLSQSFP